jgi:hypothetical protein
VHLHRAATGTAEVIHKAVLAAGSLEYPQARMGGILGSAKQHGHGASVLLLLLVAVVRCGTSTHAVLVHCSVHTPRALLHMAEKGALGRKRCSMRQPLCSPPCLQEHLSWHRSCFCSGSKGAELGWATDSESYHLDMDVSKDILTACSQEASINGVSPCTQCVADSNPGAAAALMYLLSAVH